MVTGFPNFPTGKVFAGYKNKLWQREEVAGIKVIRVWTYITGNKGTFRRTLDYLSYMIASSIASLFVRNVDLVIGTSPQFFTVCGAYSVSKFKRVPWVFELRDIWPESIKVVGAIRKNRILNWLEKLELFLYFKATAVISVTHSFNEILRSRGVQKEKLHVVTNGVDLNRFYPREKD